MKKTILALCAFAGVLCAADPAPLPADRQEAVSRLMISLQTQQLQYQQAQLALAQQKEKLATEQARYEDAVKTLRADFKIPDNCDLTVEKTWKCAPPPMPRIPAPPAPQENK